jgi:trehalose-6-phosphatase
MIWSNISGSVFVISAAATVKARLVSTDYKATLSGKVSRNKDATLSDGAASLVVSRCHPPKKKA